MPETAIKSLESRLSPFVQKFQTDILHVDPRDQIVTVAASKIREVIGFLKKDCKPTFEIMMDLFAMDYLKFEAGDDMFVPERYAVVYNLYSISSHERIILKAYLPEDNPEIDSICDLYRAANWFEREAWDLFGIKFKGHPNLTRILCHQEFVGHPMRKDYPADQYQRLKNAAPSEGL